MIIVAHDMSDYIIIDYISQHQITSAHIPNFDVWFCILKL